MNRLTNSVPQKHLRALAVKHGMQSANPGEKIESPLVKVNPNGTVTCVICRSNLKSASLWKVHVNSKAHKCNVKEAKELKDKLLRCKPTTATVKPVQTKQQAICELAPKNDSQSHGEMKTVVIEGKVKNASKELDVSRITNAPTADQLPEEFFDAAATDTKSRSADNKDAEWEQFQKEIQEVSRVSHEIFVNDQKNLAVEKEIVEINEQIQHWSKVLDLEEKRIKLSQIVEKNKDNHRTQHEDEESSEGEDFEEYPDWRSKGFK